MSVLATKRRRDLLQKRWQYVAVLLTLSLGVILYAASYDAYLNLESSYRNTYTRLALADMTVTGARSGFSERVGTLPGVAAVTARQTADIPMRVGTGDAKHTFVGRLVGMPPDSQPAVDRVRLTAGRYLSAGHSDEVVAEAHMAGHFGLQPGGTLRYFDGTSWQPVTIAGVAVSPEYLWPARSAQDALTDPDQFGIAFVPSSLIESLPSAMRKQQTLIAYAPGADRTKLDAQVAALAEQYGADSSVTQANLPSNKTLQLDVLGFRQMAIAFPILFLLAAGMATFTLLTRRVFAEREIIGTLRANGLSRGTIERHYLSYGLLLGSIAAVLGVALGVPLGWAMTGEYTAEVGIPDTLRSLHPGTILAGLAFGVATGALAALVPARVAASLDPAVAMRGETPTGTGRRSWLEALVPPMRRLPIRWRMVLRGIGRSPRRSITTVLGVVLAMVLVLVSWGLVDTTQILVAEQFSQIQHQDATIVYETAVAASTVRRAAGVPGVSSAEKVVTLDTTVHGPAGAYATQLIAFQSGTVMHSFPAGLPEQGVLLGKALQRKLGVRVGDTVLLSFGTLHSSAPATVAGFVDEPLGTFVYASQSAVAGIISGARPAVGPARLDAPDVAVVMAKFVPGVQPQATIARLEGIDGVATVADSMSLYRLAQQFLGLFYIFVLFMLAFGGLMAFALIFNTMSVNMAERSVEMATMRANGMSEQQEARLLVAENLLLTVAAIPFGLVAGYLAAAAFMASYSSDLFDYTLHMRPLTFVWASLAMLGVTALTLVVGVRVARRVDVAKVVRERAV